MAAERRRPNAPRDIDLPELADAAATTTGASVVGGGAWQLLSRILPQLTTLALSVVVARVLGPDDFGRQSFIAFVALSTTMLLAGGLKVAVMRYIAELLGRGSRSSLRALVAWSWVVQAAAAAVGAAILVATGALGAEPASAWVLAGVGVGMSILQTIPNACLLGAQRFRQTAIIGLTTDVVALPTTIAVLLAGGGITGIFAVQAAVATVNFVWTSVAARRTLREIAPAPAAGGNEWRPGVVRFALFTAAQTALTLIVWRRVEFFFLDAYSTDAQIGFYSISFAAVTALTLFPQTLASVVEPAFATLFGADDLSRIRSGYARSARLLETMALPLAAVALALGPAAITLVYGEEFSDTGPILMLMLILFPALPIYFASSALLVGLGRARIPLIFAAIGAIVTILADFLLIPRWDATGAAIGNNLGQLAVIVPTSIYAIRLAGGLPLRPRALAATAMASAVAGGLAWLVNEAVGGVFGLAIGCLVAGATFALLAWRIGILSAEDAEWLQQSAGPRIGAMGGLLRAIARPSSAA